MYVGYGANKMWVIEAAEESTKNLIIGKTLVMTRQDKYVPVRVLHEFKSPIQLSKGAILGQCQKIEGVINYKTRLD